MANTLNWIVEGLNNLGGLYNNAIGYVPSTITTTDTNWQLTGTGNNWQYQQIIGQQAIAPLIPTIPQEMIDDLLEASKRELEASKREVKAASMAEKVATPVGVAVAEPGADDEYLALADKLGIDSAAIKKAKLEKFLHEENIRVYDHAQVDKYMQSLAKKENKYWCWKPLRSKDNHGGLVTYASGHGSFVAGVYAHPVPYPVLLNIQTIVERFPEARFFVSDYQAPRPDPFLGVTLEGLGALYIIDKWNEPAFREK